VSGHARPTSDVHAWRSRSAAFAGAGGASNRSGLEARLVRARQSSAFWRHLSVFRRGERREIGLAPHAREPVIARRRELLRNLLLLAKRLLGHACSPLSVIPDRTCARQKGNWPGCHRRLGLWPIRSYGHLMRRIFTLQRRRCCGGGQRYAFVRTRIEQTYELCCLDA
jgi:hypothetical protein